MWDIFFFRLIRQNASALVASRTKVPVPLEVWEQQTQPGISRKRRAGSKRKHQDWRSWSRFRLWRKQRPLAGSVLMGLAGILVLWAPLYHLPLVLTPSNPAWSSLLVGGLLLVMAGSQVLFPFYAPVTGSIELLLSLISVLVALGGMGIGVILGLIGSSLSIAWRPTGSLRAQMAARLAAPKTHIWRNADQ